MKTQIDNKTVKREPEYTLDDVGCYVDGARGIYAIDAIVAFAESHGATIERCKQGALDHTHEETCFKSDFAGCEFVNEFEDECDDYMNENYGVEGAYWGRSEQGDWGLWTNENN